METGSRFSRTSETQREKQAGSAEIVLKKITEATGSTPLSARNCAADRGDAAEPDVAKGEVYLAARLERIPEGVRASAISRRGEYDARRLRSQREIIRDVMLSAADCDTWLTLGELRALTRYGEASISAQLRHLRKLENGGYDVTKRHREDSGTGPVRFATDGRGECVWEYRMARAVAPLVAPNSQG
jgi:hypothetical protein